MNQTDLGPLLANAAELSRATTLVRESGLRVLLLHMKSGEQMAEHKTTGAIAVYCLRGEIVFSAGPESVTLREGLLISLPGGAPHALVAKEESLLLVSVSEQPTG